MNEANAPNYKIWGFLGIALLLNASILKISFLGPWDSKSFTLGIFGLIGICFIYISWYRFTFKNNGLIPWMDNWQYPAKSAKYELLIGIFTIILAGLTGNIIPQLPDPTGLILALIGTLMALNSIYVLLSLGPLRDN
ncbi:hypothetical protein N8653_02380 [Euryarchaeota archaeon]|jgi:hypothetical protein|nr:hypothetical protein [Euryarchaeota archaeon]|tara:strand:- start:716 stop:1126 length:411 start_codon:yes stop_codon:yes gene_type:complete